ncbi:dihydrodipicolinate synthase family protein [Bordetella sp. N]|uniref:dihydrodipicolinate synthase family protein n=1 Tax=Bordetella sp. N TaxID=1746199 RepID=UPI000710582C|nr:dihydrodipicolinate synthase family protein [Bordetella sp. N]ALM82440.1 dihydrodipicolinate synthetase [Bordetella sp. N]
MTATAARALTGVFSPVLTPFDKQGATSTQRFIKHCRWLADQGVGLSVFGTNSEANSLSVQEKQDLLQALLEAGIPGNVLMPGTGLCNLPESIALTSHAVKAGCAGVLMLPPFYYKGVSDEGLFRFFSTVIDGVGDDRLRLYVYHIPPVSQVPLSANLIERLIARHGKIIAGIKDSSGDWNNTELMLKHFQSPDFSVFAGSETFLLANMRGGGAGCITATGNVNPGAINRLYRSWNEDAKAADAQQAALDKTRAIFQSVPIIPAMKRTLADHSGDAAWATVRPPLVELDDTQAGKLSAALKADGFTVPNARTLAVD